MPALPGPQMDCLPASKGDHIIQPDCYLALTMPVSEQYLDYVVDQLGCIGEIIAKKMFGGVGLYHEGFFFGLIASDVLYFKVDDETRQDYKNVGARSFQPYGEESYSMSYYEVPADVLEDTDILRAWARKAVDAAARKSCSRKKKKRL